MERTTVTDEDLNVDEMPSGYILIRKDNGTFAYLKMEPDDVGEAIDEGQIVGDDEIGDKIDRMKALLDPKVTKLRITNGAIENMDSIDDQSMCEQEVIEDGEVDGDAHIYLHQEEILEGEIVEDEMDVDELPEILEEGIVNERTVTNDEVEFVGDMGGGGRKTVNRQKRKLIRDDGTCPPQLWRGVPIPAGLTPDRIKLFKAGHLLQQLSDRVKLNRQKVEIYTRKNENLKKLVTKQRQQMHSLGFHVKEFTRFAPRRVEPARSPSPKLDTSRMSEMEQIEYERKRLQFHYEELRRQLKSLLSTYRSCKKKFVANHEKIQRGPTKRGVPSELLEKGEAQLKTLVETDSDAESQNLDPRTLSISDSIDIQPFKCYHCAFKTFDKKDLVAHIEKHVKEMRYRCSACNYFTSRITQFTAHTKSHPGLKAFKCRFCDFRSAHPAALRNHELTHSLLKPYKCTVCDFRTTRSDHLRNHMRRHSDVKAFSCTLCDYKCKFPSGMTKHKKLFHSADKQEEKVENPEKHSNVVSEKESEEEGETTEVEFNEDGTFVRITTLSRDAKSKSSSDVRRNVPEPVADAGGRESDGNSEDALVIELEDEDVAKDATEGRLDEGELRKNEGAQGSGGVGELDSGYFQSLRELCDAPRDLLNSYVIYQCVFCDYSCEMKASLTSHMRSHMEKWSFLCKQCGYSAGTPDDLRDHTDDHRDEGENGCPYCDHVAGNRERLKRHVGRRHPPGVPMACPFCDFMSSNRPAMRKHIAHFHRDRKQWQCVVCDFKAPFKSSLRRHLRKHTGERPYHCPLCEFNAAQYSHLTRHLRRFHPDEPDCLPERPRSPVHIL